MGNSSVNVSARPAYVNDNNEHDVPNSPAAQICGDRPPILAELSGQDAIPASGSSLVISSSISEYRETPEASAVTMAIDATGGQSVDAISTNTHEHSCHSVSLVHDSNHRVICGETDYRSLPVGAGSVVTTGESI
jgi:hypothetical protein